MEELERIEKAKEKEKAKPVAGKKEEMKTGRKLSYVEPPVCFIMWGKRLFEVVVGASGSKLGENKSCWLCSLLS